MITINNGIFYKRQKHQGKDNMLRSILSLQPFSLLRLLGWFSIFKAYLMMHDE